MNELKSIAIPATFAYAGVRASAALGATSQLTQIAAGIAGAGLGIWLSRKIAK